MQFNQFLNQERMKYSMMIGYKTEKSRNDSSDEKRYTVIKLPSYDARFLM